MKPLGIYIHIPFCVQKCKYCDFVSYPGCSDEEKNRYVEYLLGEIEKKRQVYSNKYSVDSIFFGGGTPTCLKTDQLIEILRKIRSCFFVESNAEISTEANPGTVTPSNLEVLNKGGFNRFSFGVQSFNDEILSSLGRIHSGKTAEEIAKAASDLGLNYNLDLMFGVPNQNLEIWMESVSKAVSLKPKHISFYSLQIEEGTPLYDEYKYDGLKIPEWDENRAMYHWARETLVNAGYHHYEVSNAAISGFECRHNLKYWGMGEYLGIGEAAHSFMDGLRNGEETDLLGDYIFTRLRLTEGFPKDEFARLFGKSFEETYKELYPTLIEGGFISDEKGRIRLTDLGLDNTNPVMSRLLNYEVK